MTAANARAVIGDNSPPEPTPLEQATLCVDAIYGEALMWLDGAVVDSEAVANGLSQIINDIRKAEKVAEAFRVADKKPHDEAASAVQASYKPLLDKCKRAADGCKKALVPWLAKLEADKRAAEEATRKIAEEATRVAQEAIRAADSANLAEREAAEALVETAKWATIDAKRAAKDSASAAPSAGGRAISLRTTYRPVVNDVTLAARHFWKANPIEMREFIQKLAEDTVRAAGKEAAFLDIPGVTINTETKAA